MSIGASGRVVIELDPALKRALHSALAQQGMTMKDWFVAMALDYVRNSTQLSLYSQEQQNATGREHRA